MGYKSVTVLSRVYGLSMRQEYRTGILCKGSVYERKRGR